MTQQCVSIRISWLEYACVTEGVGALRLVKTEVVYGKRKKSLCLNERSEWVVRKNTL